MAVAGVLSGLIDPHGVGQALLRAANRVEPIQRVPGHDPRAPGEDESLFDTEDVVELTSTGAVEELSQEDRERVKELEERDREVRQHEAAHAAAAGPHARGGAQFEYETGPDGQRYAVGGEVQTDTSPVPDDPEATVAKMEQVRAAALAPAEPSGQDHRVAARAAAEIQKARARQAQQDPDNDEESQAPGESHATGGNHAAEGAPSSTGPDRERAAGVADTDQFAPGVRQATHHADPRFQREPHPEPKLIDLLA